MVFSSAFFLFAFLPLVLLGTLMTKGTVRNVFLLIASLFFYAWGSVSHLAILLISILINYFFGRYIGAAHGSKRKIRLGLGVGVNLLMLVYLKYFNFIAENLSILTDSLGFEKIVVDDVSLPIGVSFFTFQALSYLIDVFRGKVEVQKNLVQLSIYISLFPQLVAGPIVRYTDVSNQLSRRKITLESFNSGIYRFVIGLAKKVIIANTLAVIVDEVLTHNVLEISSPLAWFVIVAYALQIYFDFSGYSDMAIGLGRMLGFSFPENFNLPYVANSIRDFWRRWHISLSTWFRDYLYIPLGGSRRGETRTLVNLLIVFFLTGLWHGASWNFVVWGLFHGLFLLLERIWLERLFKGVWKPLLNLYTLTVVLIAWVFFRIEEFPEALHFIQKLFFIDGNMNTNYYLVEYLDPKTLIVMISGVILALGIPQRIMGYVKAKNGTQQVSLFHLLGMAGILFLFFITISYLAGSTYNPFIYFRF